MQGAQPSEVFDRWARAVEQERIEIAGWVRDLGILEAWKRVADRRVGKMLLPLPMHGPALSDKMKKDSVDAICRVTWWLVCDGMTEDEEIAAWRENCDAIEEYAAALAEKAAAERWYSLEPQDSARAAGGAGREGRRGAMATRVWIRMMPGPHPASMRIAPSGDQGPRPSETSEAAPSNGWSSTACLAESSPFSCQSNQAVTK